MNKKLHGKTAVIVMSLVLFAVIGTAIVNQPPVAGVLEDQTTIDHFQLTEAPDLVGFWRFDEGAGTTAYDSSGNKNHGKINGTTWTAGTLGSALSFDGIDDYVDLPIMNDTNGYTIEMWIYPDAPLGGFLFANDERAWWKSSANTSTWYTRIESGTIGPRDDLALPLLTTGEWTHLAFTYDGVNDTKKIYKNGSTVTTKTSTSHGSGSLDLDVATANMIGKSNYNPSFNGIIDEVRIYNRALSAGEILAHYQEVLKKPQNLKKQALFELEYAKTGDKKTEIDRAIKHIQKSLEYKLWVDGLYLDTKHGKKVFDEEYKAVKKIQGIIEEGEDDEDDEVVLSQQQITILQSVIDYLAYADKLLAITAIEDAKNTPVLDPKKEKEVDKEIAKAEYELAKAGDKLSAGKPDKAIDHYKKAWEHAQHAIKHAQKLPKNKH